MSHLDRDHLVGTWRNVVVCVWRHETHATAIRGLKPVIERVQSASRAGCGLLTLVEPSAILPPADARDELAKLFKGVANAVACSALVFEAVGFRAAAGRAFTMTLNALSAQPFPHRIFATVKDAEAMFLELLPPTGDGEILSPGELIPMTNALRQRFDVAI